MTRRTLEHLRMRGVDFEYIDIEEDQQASEWVKRQNGGKERKPTLAIGREILSEPSNAELDEALERAAWRSIAPPPGGRGRAPVQ